MANTYIFDDRDNEIKKVVPLKEKEVDMRISAVKDSAKKEFSVTFNFSSEKRMDEISVLLTDRQLQTAFCRDVGECLKALIRNKLNQEAHQKAMQEINNMDSINKLGG